MSIERLTLKDVLTAATVFAVNVNGQDYRLLAGSVLDYIQSNLSFPAAFISQFSAPSASGFSVQIMDGSDNIHLILTPVAGYAAGTIVLPTLANCVDGQEVLVNCTQDVTALTITGNGSTVTGEPTTLAANDFFRLRFDDVTNTWYRVG
jgi:hypothetical protein